MKQSTQDAIQFPQQEAQDFLTDILRRGAQDMLAVTISAEVAESLINTSQGQNILNA